MRTIIFSNGNMDHPRQDRGWIQPGDTIIAADGGLHHCLALDLAPHLVVGDLDSVDPSLVARLRDAGTEIQEHPARKDQTDLELALEVAVERAADEVLILGGLGGRWDQTLANILLITQERFQRARILLVDGPQQIECLRPGTTLKLQANLGATVSLIPARGDVEGITTTGLEYELEHGSLSFGSSRGVSNELIADEATVTIEEGILICMIIDSIEK